MRDDVYWNDHIYRSRILCRDYLCPSGRKADGAAEMLRCGLPDFKRRMSGSGNPKLWV